VLSPGYVVAIGSDPHNGKAAIAHGKRKWVEGMLERMGANLGGTRESGVMVADLRSGATWMLLSDSAYLQALAFHPDGGRLATGHGDGSVNLWDLGAEASRPAAWSAHAGGVMGVAYTSDGRFLATIGMDAAIRLWCARSNRLVATLVSHNDADFVAVTAEGHYACTQGGLASVVFRHDGRAFPFDQFDLNLNRPDLVHEALGYADADLIDLYAKAHHRRVRRMGFTPEQLAADFHVPALELVSDPQRQVPLAGGRRRARWTACSSRSTASRCPAARGSPWPRRPRPWSTAWPSRSRPATT